MKWTQFPIFEVGPVCNLATQHLGKCPSGDSDRRLLLDSAELMGDALIVESLPDPRTITPNASWPGNVGTHWGFCVQTDALRNVRGYDERFVKFGPEDSDLVRRLKRPGYVFRYDPEMYALHVLHPVEDDGNDEMSEPGRQIVHDPPTRNDPNTWGEGAAELCE